MSKSITAGMCIGLGCVIFESCDNKILGSFLFSIGLLTICMCQLTLFTGQVGSNNNFIFLLEAFSGNLIGISIMSLLFRCFGDSIFMLSVGCGMLMQIAVVAYKKGLPWLTMLCVGAFILSGFKHCIAYIYNFQSLKVLLLCILGNTIGAKIFYYGGVSCEDR